MNQNLFIHSYVILLPNMVLEFKCTVDLIGRGKWRLKDFHVFQVLNKTVRKYSIKILMNSFWYQPVVDWRERNAYPEIDDDNLKGTL